MKLKHFLKILRPRRISLGLKNSRQGFTLIEILVVVFVLGVGLLGALSFFNINLNNQFEAKNELIAVGLVQEGSDLIRSIVDYSYLNGQPWYDEIINKTDATDYCSSIDRDILYGDNFRCRTEPKKAEEVCFYETSGVYSQAKNCPSNQIITTDFKRSLVVETSEQNGFLGTDLEAGDCIKIISTVGWPISDSSCASNINNCPKKTTSTDIICKPRQ